MKKIGLYVIRTYLQLALFFYFKKIEVKHVKNLSKDKGVLILGNHQNALLDPLLIAVKSKRFSYFLTRASVFKKPFLAKFFKSLLMLPVYRVRDGWSNLSKNETIFKTCSQLLSQNQAITLFPEGNHNIKRTVRPLSKGFTRIIDETFKTYPNSEIRIMPVGFNYEKAEGFPDSVSVIFGNEIVVKPSDTVEDLKNTVRNQLCQLTTNIDSVNYDYILKRLNNLQVDFLKPNLVNACVSSNFKNCGKPLLQKHYVLQPLFRICMILLLLPVYLVWKLWIKPKIKEPEFVSTFRFAIAASLTPIFIAAIVLGLLLMGFFKLSILYLLLVLITTLLTVKL